MTNIIFNKTNNGSTELKSLLPYFDAQFKYDSLLSDIEQHTPYLINFIGKEAYNIAYYHYNDTNPPGDYPTFNTDQEAILTEMVKNIQMYIITMASLTYMQSGDLEHTTAGRKQNKTDNQATPWEWQINRDDAAHMKRAYRALDRVFVLLDELNHESWTSSSAFAKAKNVFISSTEQLDDIYPIGDSGYLYHKLLPFMERHELEKIYPIIGETKYNELKTALKGTEDIAQADQLLISYIRNAVAFLTIADGYELFNAEMFPDKITYSDKLQERLLARAEKTQNLRKTADIHLRNVQRQHAIMTANTTTIDRDPTYGLQDDTKHVTL